MRKSEEQLPQKQDVTSPRLFEEPAVGQSCAPAQELLTDTRDAVHASLNAPMFGTIEDRYGEFRAYAESRLKKDWQSRVIGRVQEDDNIDLLKQAWSEFVKAVKSRRVKIDLAVYLSFVGQLVNKHEKPGERVPNARRVWRRTLTAEEKARRA